MTSSPASGANLAPMLTRPVGNDGGIPGNRSTSVENARKDADRDEPLGSDQTHFQHRRDFGLVSRSYRLAGFCADSSAQDRADQSSAGSTLRCGAKRENGPRATETCEPTGNGLGSPNQRACLYANPRKDRAKWRGNATLSNELGS